MERVLVPDVENFLESLLDEDEGDQGGKVLLGEAGDVADEGAEVGGHQDQAEDKDPNADAEPKGKILPTLAPGNGSSMIIVECTSFRQLT